MDDYGLLINLHRSGWRQGPGCDDATELALNLAMVDRAQSLNIADIGCGTGASTLLLASLLPKAQIVAVDFLQEFLNVLEERAECRGFSDRISTLACSMDQLPFGDGVFDVIWSEGAIYNMGFEKGLAAWRRHLKVGGRLVVSEITWLTDSRPQELQSYWQREYSEIDVASAKFQLLEKHGYSPLGYFVLPERCWLDNYYRPLQARFDAFLQRHANSESARAIVASERHEIDLYERCKDYVGYGMYVAMKLPSPRGDERV